MSKQVPTRPDTPIIRHGLDLHGTHLSYLQAGPVGGPPVVLIHGLGWDAARLWSGQITRLAADGWRVLAPDLRGNGGSSLIRAPLRVPDLADDVAAMLRSLATTRPVLVGFSMGGMVATDLALRPGFDAAGLMIACGGVTCPPQAEIAVDAMLKRAAELGPETFAAEQANAIFAPHWADSNPDAVAAFKVWRAEMDQDSLAHSFRAPYGCDYAHRLSELSCPVAVVAAAEDSFVDVAAARKLAGAIPDATFDVIPACGHMAPIEAPDAFSATLTGFLARVAPQTEGHA